MGSEMCIRDRPERVFQADVPLPYAANLEALSLPGVEDVVAAAKRALYV